MGVRSRLDSRGARPYEPGARPYERTGDASIFRWADAATPSCLGRAFERF